MATTSGEKRAASGGVSWMWSKWRCGMQMGSTRVIWGGLGEEGFPSIQGSRRMTWPEGSSNWNEPCPSQVIRIISLGVYRRRGRVGKPVCGQDTGGKTGGATIGLQVSRLLVLHFERQFLLRLVTERARHRQSVGGRLVWRHEKLAERSRILNGRKDRRIDAHVFPILECKRQRVYVAALFQDVPVDAE